MMPAFIISYLVPASLLSISVYTDLRFKKVHNKFLLIILPLVLLLRYLDSGFDGLSQGFIASFVALALCLPLVLSKAIGAGDMKLLMVFSFLTNMDSIFWIIIYSFVWGTILGVIRVLLDKEALMLLKNTINVIKQKKQDVKKWHTIPFTVAILLGWMTMVSLNYFQ